MSNDLTVKSVLPVLDTFVDPETGRGIVSTGQVADVTIEGTRVTLTLGLTTLVASLREEIRDALVEHVKKALPTITDVEIDLTVHQRPATKLGQVGLQAKCVVAVGSGKGGVGKSTLSTILAYGLMRAGSRVGLLDADVYGPSIPHLLGSTARPTATAEERIEPVVIDNMQVMSLGFLVPAGEAVIWRGPMLHGAITQFLRDTAWSNLDYLIVDMPPGTGDVALSLSQLIPLSGVVVVCTPQELALLDAVKAIAMFRKVDIDVLGMIENMSHFVCPDCDARHAIFGTGGARRKAEAENVPFLGEVPLNMTMRLHGDAGTIGSLFEDDSMRGELEALSTELTRRAVDSARKKRSRATLPVL